MAYKIGDRMQATFLPPVINDYIGGKDPVRVYDSFVEALDFNELGISLTDYKAGADEYYPKAMLKLIIYGYSYGIRSSRKLERACHHNLSFIWLMTDLKPDYRTIARFRSQYKEAIKKVLKQCVRVCLNLDLIEGNVFFTDGSKFRANASINNTWSKERCEQYLKKTEEQIDQIINESEQIDAQEQDDRSLVRLKEPVHEKARLINKIKDVLNRLNSGEPKAYQQHRYR